MRRVRNVMAAGMLLACCVIGDGCVAAGAEGGHDVVVYGGTSGGVAAAVQAARMGRSVVLIEPTRHIGGLTSGGLGWTDSGDKSAIGGISREFYRRIKRHYDDPAAWEHERPQELNRGRGFGLYEPDADAMWVFEPRVAEKVFREMLAEAGVEVAEGERLDLAEGAGVVKDGARIERISMESGRSFAGRVFIDATYEGDLMARAGVSYTTGREANALYGETLNGVQVGNSRSHRFVRDVDPYVVPGDVMSGLVWGVHGTGPGEDGQADHRIQAYCFRMCMTDVPANRVAWPKPDDYDERRYELLLRNFEAGDMRLPLKIDMMPNRKTDTNNNHAFSTDNIGMSYDYAEAGYAERERIVAEHASYQKGLMWTLANHPRVPAEIRQRVSRWGLAADEFTDNGNWPHQIYVREARRMVSDYVVTELDCRRVRVTPESVGLGSYNMDSHNVQRYVTAEGYVQNEGDIQVSPGGSYMISYLSIRPRRAECENLLVPVCLSASHIAYGSIRMEPVFMVLGQSAATAAVQAIEAGIAVQDVSYERLRARLLADGQSLDATAPPAPPRVTLRAAELGGIVIDEGDAAFGGAWVFSESVGPYVGAGYRHDDNADRGAKWVKYKARVERAGVYDVRIGYSAHPNRASGVRVVASSGGERVEGRVDQRVAPTIRDAFVSIGRLRCAAGDEVRVRIDNGGADGYVIADAVWLAPVE